MGTAEISDFLKGLENLNERELYAGLAVLASGYKADWIRNVQCGVVPKIKKSSPNSPYLTEESKRACRDIVARVTSRDDAVSKKALEEIKTGFVTDYFVEAGKLFFEELRAKFWETIYGKDGACERFKKGLLVKSDLVTAISNDLLAKGRLDAVYTPLLAYFALLVVIKMS